MTGSFIALHEWRSGFGEESEKRTIGTAAVAEAEAAEAEAAEAEAAEAEPAAEAAAAEAEAAEAEARRRVATNIPIAFAGKIFFFPVFQCQAVTARLASTHTALVSQSLVGLCFAFPSIKSILPNHNLI